MNTLADLGQWWNLIYVLPFGMGVVLVLLSVLGAGRHGAGHHGGHGLHLHGHGGHGLGHAVGHGGHAIAHGGHAAHGHTAHVGHATHAHGHTTHAHAHAHAGHSHGHGHDGHSGEHQGGKVAFSLAGALHIQNIPPLLLLQNFLLLWGIFGWAANQYFARGAPDPAQFIKPSLMVASGGSLIVGLVIAAVMSRFAPSDETFAVTKRDLVGLIGEAVSPITDRMGSVYVRDATGTLHHLPSRIMPDGASIAKGEKVVIVKYHAEKDFYWVEKSPV